MPRIGAAASEGRLARIAARGLYAAAGVAGYILSPASWWNDAVVNIPLALAAAKLLESLAGVPLDAGFAAAYWASNALGIVLMFVGASGARGGRPSARSLLLGLAAATLYTVAVVAGIRLLSG